MAIDYEDWTVKLCREEYEQSVTTSTVIIMAMIKITAAKNSTVILLTKTVTGKATIRTISGQCNVRKRRDVFCLDQTT